MFENVVYWRGVIGDCIGGIDSGIVVVVCIGYGVYSDVIVCRCYGVGWVKIEVVGVVCFVGMGMCVKLFIYFDVNWFFECVDELGGF